MREHHPTTAVEISSHALAVDCQAFDDIGHQADYVIHQGACIRDDDPLGRGMADVALVPERLVLERHLGVATHGAGETADALAEHGIALVWHGRRPLLLRAEWLPDFGDLGGLPETDVGCELFQAAGENCQCRHEMRMPVAGDHLGGDRRHLQPKALQCPLLDPGINRGMGANRSGELAHPDLLPNGAQPGVGSLELIQPAGQDEPERKRFGVHPVGPPGHQRAALLDGTPADAFGQPVHVLEQQVGSPDQLEGKGGIQDI